MDQPDTPEPFAPEEASADPDSVSEPGSAEPVTPPSRPEADQGHSVWDDDLPVRPSQSLIDTSSPHPYRMYNFLIGGKDNFQVDRDAAAELLRVRPDTALTARAVESFCARCVVELSKAGIRQFVQLGSSISVPRSHDSIARASDPDTRFVYVAEDPVTLLHARAVLAEDNVEIIGGNFRDPAHMLAEPALNALVDLDRPCGFLLFGMLDYIANDRRARGALRSVYDRAAPGSYLAFMHVLEVGSDPTDRAVDVLLVQDDIQLTPRHVPEIEKIIEGFELWDAEGLVPVTDWRPVTDGKAPGPELSSRAGAVGAVIVKR